jgi:hypothetical protein
MESRAVLRDRSYVGECVPSLEDQTRAALWYGRTPEKVVTATFAASSLLRRRMEPGGKRIREEDDA